MRDTAPALQSITKHNHMARAGEEGGFDSEQRIQGWKGGASQIWAERPRELGGPGSVLAFMPALPPQAISVQELGLYHKSYQAGELNDWTGSAEDLRHTAHKHGMPDSIGKGNFALRGQCPCSLGSCLLRGRGATRPVSQAHKELKQSGSHTGWGPKGSPGRACVGCLGSELNVAAHPA